MSASLLLFSLPIIPCALFSLPLYFSFALPLFIHSSPVSFGLPAFFTIIISPSSRPDSFYLLTFFAKILSSSSTSNALSLAIVFACSTTVLTLALCRSPSLCSLLKTCRLQAKFSLLLFVEIIAFVSCNKKFFRLCRKIFFLSCFEISFFKISCAILHDIIARRCAVRFPAKKSLLLLAPTPRVHADYFPLPGKSVRTDVR